MSEKFVIFNRSTTLNTCKKIQCSLNDALVFILAVISSGSLLISKTRTVDNRIRQTANSFHTKNFQNSTPFSCFGIAKWCGSTSHTLVPLLFMRTFRICFLIQNSLVQVILPDGTFDSKFWKCKWVNSLYNYKLTVTSMRILLDALSNTKPTANPAELIRSRASKSDEPARTHNDYEIA